MIAPPRRLQFALLAALALSALNVPGPAQAATGDPCNGVGFHQTLSTIAGVVSAGDFNVCLHDPVNKPANPVDTWVLTITATAPSTTGTAVFTFTPVAFGNCEVGTSISSTFSGPGSSSGSLVAPVVMQGYTCPIYVEFNAQAGIVPTVFARGVLGITVSVQSQIVLQDGLNPWRVDNLNRICAASPFGGSCNTASLRLDDLRKCNLPPFEPGANQHYYTFGCIGALVSLLDQPILDTTKGTKTQHVIVTFISDSTYGTSTFPINATLSRFYPVGGGTCTWDGTSLSYAQTNTFYHTKSFDFPVVYTGPACMGYFLLDSTMMVPFSTSTAQSVAQPCSTAHLALDAQACTLNTNSNSTIISTIGNVTNNFPETFHLCGPLNVTDPCTAIQTQSVATFSDRDLSIFLFLSAFLYAWYRCHITGPKWIFAVIILTLGTMSLAIPGAQAYSLGVAIATIIAMALLMLVINRFGIHRSPDI